VKADAGTWEWNGNFHYRTEVLYTCGPYGNFKDIDGNYYEELVSTCAWNKTWDPPVLDPCAAIACQTIPFPPKESGLQHLADPNNPITLASEFTIYDVSLPLTINFPGPSFCEDPPQTLLVVGRVPLDSKAPLEITFKGEETTEAFHVVVDPAQNFIQRWAMPDEERVGLAGEPGDGTTIDMDEPFLLRIRCDADGWMVKPNKEVDAYPHFFHVFPVTDILNVVVDGDLEIGYIGFGDIGEAMQDQEIIINLLYPVDLQPAPAVSFNLTFACPDGMVFDHDWFATPFVLTTCLPNGVFDVPDWSMYSCILRK
jgi:hypothetical protein